MPLELTVNGQAQVLTELSGGATLADTVSAMQLKSDRVAIECNGEIVPRSTWSNTTIQPGDRLEIVHFVGGGTNELSATQD